MEFDNQVMIITGAAGNLGGAVALAFAEAGARRVPFDNNQASHGLISRIPGRQ